MLPHHTTLWVQEVSLILLCPSLPQAFGEGCSLPNCSAFVRTLPPSKMQFLSLNLGGGKQHHILQLLCSSSIPDFLNGRSHSVPWTLEWHFQGPASRRFSCKASFCALSCISLCRVTLGNSHHSASAPDCSQGLVLAATLIHVDLHKLMQTQTHLEFLLASAATYS